MLWHLCYCVFAGVLYDSIGQHMSMTRMFVFFAGCMAATAVLFALVAVRYQPRVPTQHVSSISDQVETLDDDADDPDAAKQSLLAGDSSDAPDARALSA